MLGLSLRMMLKRIGLGSSMHVYYDRAELHVSF